jgi:ribosomal protein L35AE/L33A
MGFRRGKTTQNENHALVKVEGLNDRKEVPYYLGKRIVYVYRTKRGFRVNILNINHKDYLGKTRFSSRKQRSSKSSLQKELTP